MGGQICFGICPMYLRMALILIDFPTGSESQPCVRCFCRVILMINHNNNWIFMISLGSFKLQIQFHVKYVVTSYLNVCLDEVSCEASCPCLEGEGSIRVAHHSHGVLRCQFRYRCARSHVPRRPVPEFSIA